MRNVDTIIFDLGGVLIDWNPRYVFETVFTDEEELEFFLKEVCSGSWNAEQDRGRTFAEAIKLKIEEYPSYRNEIPLYFERWTEMISGPIQETVQILNSIYNRGDLRLYALTNWSQETFPYAWKTFPFLRLFEGILVSGKEAMIKPNLDIYRLLLERYDIAPHNAIFIDDSAKNVTAAEELGIHGIHFNNAEQLAESLGAVGVKI